jgi:hypothetical protein
MMAGALAKIRARIDRIACTAGARMLRLESKRFDRRAGIEVRRNGKPETALTLVAGTPTEGIALDYQGQPPRITRWWMRSLPRNLGGFTFVDLGSGQGRVLFVAAARGFGRVLGIEYVVENHERAMRNLRVTHLAAASAITLILGDAGGLEFPPVPLVLHFANPFTEPVMARVLENLRRSYEAAPRPIVATYLQRREERPGRRTSNVDLLAAEALFVRHSQVPKRRPPDRLLLRPFRVDLFESAEAVGLREAADAMRGKVPRVVRR